MNRYTAGLWLYRLSLWLNPALAEATTTAAELMAKRMVDGMVSQSVVVKRQPNPDWQ